MDGGDRQLVRAIHAGDRNALELLYRRNAERLWRFAWTMTRSRESAADVVQEAFVRAMRSSRQFKGQASAATWLFAIARNIAIDHLRHKRLERISNDRVSILRLTPSESSPDALAEADRRFEPRKWQCFKNEQRDAVRDAVVRLRPAHRTVVTLCHLCDLSIKEVAATLGWKESRVKVTLHRARRALRDILKETWNDDTFQKGKTQKGET